MSSLARQAVRHIDSGSKALSFLLAGFVGLLVLAAVFTTQDIGDIIAWTKGVFGYAFLVLCAGLVFTTLYSWVRLRQDGASATWLESGLQAANGITTLALTYTLLGISLGIGTLADRSLTPESVPMVVSELTADFSMAFMTTVVGLPLSAVLRTLLTVTAAAKQDAERQSIEIIPPQASDIKGDFR